MKVAKTLQMSSETTNPYLTTRQVLFALRKEKHMSQIAFGREAGWGENVQGNFEDGTTPFLSEHLETLIKKGFLEEDISDKWYRRFITALKYEAECSGEQALAMPLTQRKTKISDQLEKTFEIIPFCLQRHQIVAKIHDEYAIELDREMGDELTALNRWRKAVGKRDYFASTCYRLIQPPEFGATEMVLYLSPMNFASAIITADPEASPSAKEHVRQKIETVAQTIPEDQRSNHPVMNANCDHAFGTEITLVTSDGKILLRRRGKDVLFHREKWDISCSGYCTYGDRTSSGELDIEHTVVHEVQQELGIITADNEEIVFTGLWLEYKVGGSDMLVYWPIEATSDELIKLITDKCPVSAEVFDTTKRAREPWVWDGKNLIVDFDATAITQALKAICDKEGGSTVLIPEAYACLRRSLEITGRSTKGLETLSS